MVGVSFSICCFIFLIIFAIVYFSKERINNVDNKIFTIILIVNLIGIFLDIGGFISFRKLGVDNLFNILIAKIYLLYFLTYTFLLMLYIFNLTFSTKKFRHLITIFVFLCLIAMSLPIELHFDGVVGYTDGLCVNFAYGIVFLNIFIMVFCLIKSLRKLGKNYIPLLAFVVLMIIVFLIQKINPEIGVLLLSNSIVTVLMYFTIENPDIKMLNEVYKNKELVEQTYEDKSNFLFEMTQEVRDPLYNLTKICEEVSNESDVEKIKANIRQISNSARELDFIVNDVLNVSTLDVQKVKLMDDRYSLKGLYEDLVSRVHVNNNVEFRTKIPNNLPYVYGDAIKIKQVLYSLLMNSVNKTEEGFIEFSIDTIEKYDVVRVIFTIIDSGSGMSIDKINEILSTTSEFDSKDLKLLEKSEFNIKLCQKIIKALGGNLMIKSKVGKGTEVILTIDQRKFDNEEKDRLIKNYDNRMYGVKKILVVCQDKELINNLKRVLNNDSNSVSYILYGMDAVDRIKSGKKYDYILLQDDMKQMSGYETLKELKNINKFKTPVIVMLNKLKENIKDHYIEDGFSDYIFLDNLNEEIKRITDKY